MGAINPLDPENPDPEIVKWLKAELNKMLDEKFSKLPWWCMLCGEGGNYDGERPHEYWFPPVDHVCPKKDPMQKLKGIVES